MSSTWGNHIKYSLFGESHGSGIGIVIDGLPPGLLLDMQLLEKEMLRRKPGSSPLATTRQEDDQIEFLSGVFQGRTTGTPLCAVIRNTDHRSRDYEKMKHIVRPGHADYTANIKYGGFQDYRGGGHFSGRLTAPIVLAGAIAKQLLSAYDITILSHIYQIGGKKDTSFLDMPLNSKMQNSLSTMPLPTVDTTAAEAMEPLIKEVKEKGDSIGGIIEGAVLHLPAGIGNPFFDSLESNLSHMFFSIPGVKGVEFGSGFALSGMTGSEANDSFYLDNNTVKTSTNHCGGILGGISNGMPLVFRVAFKPTASITLEQNTVNISAMENTKLCVEGRHDPCIVLRAIPVVEAAAAMVILDFILGQQSRRNI